MFAFSIKQNLNYRLPTLYAQLGRVTLAPSVLPRRLARKLAGAVALKRKPSRITSLSSSTLVPYNQFAFITLDNITGSSTTLIAQDSLLQFLNRNRKLSLFQCDWTTSKIS